MRMVERTDSVVHDVNVLIARCSRGVCAAAVVVAAVVCAPQQAQAQMRCTVNSTSAVNFGAYDIFSTAPLDAAGAVSVECSNVGPSDALLIELSRGDSNRFLPRAMARPRFNLEYNLYLDAARTLVWGDGTSGTSSYHGRPPDARAISIPIYARIPPRQNVEPGPYADHIVLTVQY